MCWTWRGRQDEEVAGGRGRTGDQPAAVGWKVIAVVTPFWPQYTHPHPVCYEPVPHGPYVPRDSAWINIDLTDDKHGLRDKLPLNTCKYTLYNTCSSAHVRTYMFICMYMCICTHTLLDVDTHS